MFVRGDLLARPRRRQISGRRGVGRLVLELHLQDDPVRSGKQRSDKMKYLILVLLLSSGCGQAPVAGVSATVTASALTITCPTGMSLVQGTTCEETAAHANATQAQAQVVCANQVMGLCSASARMGQWAKAPQEQVGQKYWLADAGDTIEDSELFPVTSGTYPYFCCTQGVAQ